MGYELSVQDLKSDLRRLLLEKRRTLTLQERRGKSSSIVERLRALPAFQEAALVSSYIGYGEEVETADLVRQLIGESRRVAVPTLRAPGGTPAFAEIRAWEELTPNALGILEPDSAFLRIAATEHIPLFVVPGVGFDAAGHRLGYGIGFYDRALSAASPDALVVGLAFDIQIADPIPVDRHDLPVDVIMTESRLIKASPRAKTVKEVCES